MTRSWPTHNIMPCLRPSWRMLRRRLERNRCPPPSARAARPYPPGLSEICSERIPPPHLGITLSDGDFHLQRFLYHTLVSKIRLSRSFVVSAMTSWLPYDVQSLLPRSSPQTSGLPTPGDAAPEIPRSSIVVNGGSVSPYSGPSLGTIIAFVRHCGCPFAEKEIRMLGEVRKRHDEREVQIVVVQHSDEGQTREWWSTIG